LSERQDILKELDREMEYYAEHTRRQYFSHVTEYLDYVKEQQSTWEDRETAYSYMKALQKRGHSQNHINYLMRGPIGALFRSHGLRMPVKLPKTKVSLLDLSHRVAFSTVEVEKLIRVVKESGNPTSKFLLAMSTTYGLRAAEIRMVRKEDAHKNKKTIFVHTLKGGVDREHLVPPQIASYVFDYEYPILSANRMYEIFSAVAKQAGIDRDGRKGFHAIRHGLATELVYSHGVDQTTAFKFLRWSGGTMLNIYATPYMPDIDKAVFEKHPFLGVWSE
jgi:integrase